MADPTLEVTSNVDHARTREHLRLLILSLLLLLLAVGYAFVAGWQTAGDFDLGWQLAAGRYVVEHRAIPSTDLFTYTAQGKPWMYPPFSGVIFYLLYTYAGFSALSLFNAIACALTVLLCVNWRRPLSMMLVLAAVPLLAQRTQARADAFTVILFAAFLRILWAHLSGRKALLRLMPILMVAWANLHLGFLAGFGVLLGYILAELLNVARGVPEAKPRLLRASPWIVLTALAPLVNMWGVHLYQAFVRQNAVSQEHARFIGEWHRQPITLEFLAQALRLRDPASGFWWLLLVAVGGVVYAIWRRNFAAAGFLICAVYVAIAHLRFQALFAIVAIVVAGDLWDNRWARSGRVLALLLIAAGTLTALRIRDVIDDRAHLANSEITTFGAGESWWYPERAAEFMVKNYVPGDLFNAYDQGGFLMFRLYPTYLGYVDGRAVPFGTEFLERLNHLLTAGPDSPEWEAEAHRWGIETMILPAARYAGLETYPFDLYCRSAKWKPVYLDDTAIVLVRNSAKNKAFIGEHRVDCNTVKLMPTAQQQAEPTLLYNFYANRAAIYYMLERDAEALASYHQAQQIFDGDPNLHLAIGQLYQAEGQNSDAEREYRASIALRPTDPAWYGLARLYAGEHRYDEAVKAVKKSAALSYDPAPRYRALQALEQRMQTK